MNIKTDIARLERAGAEHSAWMEKLSNAVDNMAKHLAKTLPHQRESLPRGYFFESCPNGDYALIKGSKISLRNTSFGGKCRKDLLDFAADVADGWLNEVAEYLEKETENFKRTTEQIEQVLAKT